MKEKLAKSADVEFGISASIHQECDFNITLDQARLSKEILEKSGAKKKP
jgi:hypothetical protein